MVEQMKMFEHLPITFNKYKPIMDIPDKRKIEFWYCARIEWGYVIKEYPHYFEADLLGVGIFVKVLREHVVE